MKKALLDRIDQEVSKLNDLDVEGHIWWNKFRNVVEETPEIEEQQELNIDLKNLTLQSDLYKFKKKE